MYIDIFCILNIGKQMVLCTIYDIRNVIQARHLNWFNIKSLIFFCRQLSINADVFSSESLILVLVNKSVQKNPRFPTNPLTGEFSNVHD